jgi:multidrug resistance efflux pump
MFFMMGGPSAFIMSAEGFVLHDTSYVSPHYEGQVKKILVHPGEYVNKGQLVAIMESMKMQQDLMLALTEAGSSAGGTSSTQKLHYVERYRKLLGLYDDGKLFANEDGYIGTKVPKVGETVKAGEPLIDISSNVSYVIAYINENALFQAKPGDKVTIHTAGDKAIGEVTQLLPNAEALPKQIQYPYAVTRLGRAIRVDFIDKDPFPINQHVTVNVCYTC